MIQQEQYDVTPTSGQEIIRASLGAYLEELRESGIEGFPAKDSYEARHHETPAAITGIAAQQTPLSTSAVKGPVQHETLEHIRKTLGDCARCKLGATRKNLVFGVGNPKARLVFVGEGPGADEDEKGEPFVGDAGRMLNRVFSRRDRTAHPRLSIRRHSPGPIRIGAAPV